MITLQTQLKNIPKIIPKYYKILEKMELHTVEDFLLYFPFRYDDFSQASAVSTAVINQTVTIEGVVTKAKFSRIPGRKMTITEITVEDANKTPLKAVWFNQAFVLESLPEGTAVRLSGKIALKGKTLQMSNPSWERANREATNTGCLVPVYSETRGITSKWIRWQIKPLLELAKQLDDLIPYEIRTRLNLYDIYTALTQIHFPESREKLLRAQKRFAFQEMFLVQLKTLQVKNEWENNSSLQISFDEKLIQDFVKNLPFQLTGAQRKASFEILKDLEKPMPMNRLLNGDVGSGKTMVAAIASLQAMSAGFQVAILAPTEVLAKQHFESFCKIFKNYNVNIALLTNSYKKISASQDSKNKNLEIGNLKLIGNWKLEIGNYSRSTLDTSRPKLLETINNGTIKLIIGTHAIIQKDVEFKNLALIIIDEQHRFGVAQRAFLQHTILTDTDLTQTNTELLYADLTYQIRGCFFTVKKTLGLGHKEVIYQKAFLEELTKNNIPFQREASIDIKYNDKKIGTYRPDFIVDDKIIVELKALPSVGKFEKQQVWHYLKGSGYKLALLVNFGREDIEIERFIHTIQHESVSSPHKSVSVPHLLTMTATPIPRTLAIAMFGSLELSILDEMPKNRKDIVTRIISPKLRQEAYEFIRQQVQVGRQAFVILPLVEDSKVLTEIKAATSEHQRLSEEIFPDLNLGLLHGKLKSKEKESVMEDFKNKTFDILVATSVVEVGIDIPNASVIVIEDAERFGLSQLHQFRGRVGRGEHQSYCFLFTNSNTEKAVERLQAMEDTNDGFEISQKDLLLRGPGQFFGLVQSGLPDIAMEHLSNIKLVKFARAEAQTILETDPQLKKHPFLQDALKKFQEKIHLE